MWDIDVGGWGGGGGWGGLPNSDFSEIILEKSNSAVPSIAAGAMAQQVINGMVFMQSPRASHTATLLSGRAAS